MNHSVLYAYALGYYVGRVEGNDDQVFQFADDNEKVAYKFGYDRGVADYCTYELGE